MTGKGDVPYSFVVNTNDVEKDTQILLFADKKYYSVDTVDGAGVTPQQCVHDQLQMWRTGLMCMDVLDRRCAAVANKLKGNNKVELRNILVGLVKQFDLGAEFRDESGNRMLLVQSLMADGNSPDEPDDKEQWYCVPFTYHFEPALPSGICARIAARLTNELDVTLAAVPASDALKFKVASLGVETIVALNARCTTFRSSTELVILSETQGERFIYLYNFYVVQ